MATPGQLSYPRVKPEHRPYRTIDGNVRIGSVIHGIGAEIEDSEGWVWSLTQAMDGTHGVGTIASKVARAHPPLTEADVLGAIGDLYEAGFLEDASAPARADFSERERVRYGRGVPLLRWMDQSPRRDSWEMQLKLRNAHVLLIGLGGAGGAAAQGLVASGVGKLHCVDHDVVEFSNLNRQLLYREPDVGRTKVEAGLAALRGLNSDVTVTGECHEVHSVSDLSCLLAQGPHPNGYDLLVLSADQPPLIRRWANQACLAAGTPWIDGGYRGPRVSVGLYVPGRGGCWECHRTSDAASRDLRLPADQDEDSVSPRMPWSPANAVTASLTGALLVHAALSILTGTPRLDPGFRFGMNLMLPGEPFVERYPRRPDCPACNQAADQ